MMCFQGTVQYSCAERRHSGHTGLLDSQREGSVVLVGQRSGHPSHQLLPGSLHLSCEFIAEVTSQNNHQHITQELLMERQKKQIGVLNEDLKRICIKKQRNILNPQSLTHSASKCPQSSLMSIDSIFLLYLFFSHSPLFCLDSHTFYSQHIYLPVVILILQLSSICKFRICVFLLLLVEF